MLLQDQAKFFKRLARNVFDSIMHKIYTCMRKRSDQPGIDVIVIPELLTCVLDDPEFIPKIIEKNHNKLRNIAKKYASDPVKGAIIVTMTFKKINYDPEEFKKEFGGKTRSSSKLDLPAPKRAKTGP